jgi:phage tail-like protein
MTADAISVGSPSQFRGRGLCEPPPTAFPLSNRLPSLLRDDAFLEQFCAGLDGLLSYVFEVLDNLDAYLDPELAPSDFLRWIGTWVGAAVDPDADGDRPRQSVKRALHAHRARGTATGITELIELQTGLRPEVHDPGFVTTSQTPSGDSDAPDASVLVIRVRAENDEEIDMTRLNTAIQQAKPVHLPHRVEVVRP